jgi:hypothetical protein
MEDFKPYGVTMLVTPPTTPPVTRASLTPHALTCCLPGEEGKTQQRYYPARQVEQVLATDEVIIGCHEREIAALRQYIDVLLSDLLAHPELPESIHKSLYIQRQTLIVAKEQADA